MKNELLVALSVCVVAMPGCAPQHKVSWVKGIPRKGAPAGIYYSLPKTVVTIKIPITKTTTIAGPYIGYADKLNIELPKELREPSIQELEFDKRPTDLDEDSAKVEDCKTKVKECEDKVKNCEKQVKECEQQGKDCKKEKEDCQQLVKKCDKTTKECNGTIKDFRDLQKGKGLFRSKVESYKLGSPETTTAARPDKDQVYRVEIQSGYQQTRELMVELSEMGLMIVGDSSARDMTLDYVVATVKAASRYGAAFVPPGGPLPDYNAARKKKDAIDKLRKRRGILISGYESGALTSLSAAVLDRMLKEIDKEEARLLADFWSKSIKAANVIVEYIPAKNLTKQEGKLFRFTPQPGNRLVVSRRGGQAAALERRGPLVIGRQRELAALPVPGQRGR